MVSGGKFGLSLIKAKLYIRRKIDIIKADAPRKIRKYLEIPIRIFSIFSIILNTLLIFNIYQLL